MLALRRKASASLGAIAVIQLVVESDTQLVATAPAHSAGVVNVRVATPVSKSSVVTADQFAYE
jgi:hypothetical protein